MVRLGPDGDALKYYNLDESDSDMSPPPSNLYVPKRSLCRAPAMSFTPADMDTLIRFPNEIAGIPPLSPSKKRKRGAPGTSPKKKTIAVAPVDDDDEIMMYLNAKNIRERYGREDRQVRLDREARMRGTLVMGDRVREVSKQTRKQCTFSSSHAT